MKAGHLIASVGTVTLGSMYWSDCIVTLTCCVLIPSSLQMTSTQCKIALLLGPVEGLYMTDQVGM